MWGQLPISDAEQDVVECMHRFQRRARVETPQQVASGHFGGLHIMQPKRFQIDAFAEAGDIAHRGPMQVE